MTAMLVVVILGAGLSVGLVQLLAWASRAEDHTDRSADA